MSKCGHVTEVYSRVSGYFRPVASWNEGKRQEFVERVTFDAGEFLKRLEEDPRPAYKVIECTDTAVLADAVAGD